MSERPFWETRKLDEMSRGEWESLCDGCGKCCLHKLEDEDTGLVHYTSIVCRYLDQKKCRCTVYDKRRQLVPTCWELQPADLDQLYWMPSTCAYRLLHEGKGLPIWHPLITGSRRAMITRGHTVTGKVLSEDDVPEQDWQDHILPWS